MPETVVDPPAASKDSGGWFSPEAAAELDAQFKAGMAKKPADEPARRPDGTFLPQDEPKKVEPAPITDPKALPALDKYVQGQTKAKDWDAIKAERDAAKAEAEAARKERDALKARTNAVDPVQFDSLRKERDDYLTRLREVAIERDPGFSAEYDRNLKVVLDGARSIMGSQGDAILKALELSPDARDAAIDGILKDIPDTRRPFIIAAAVDAQTKLSALRSARESKIADAKANWEKWQTESRTSEVARLQQERGQSETALATLVQKWQDPKEGLPLLQKREGDATWNSEVDATVARAGEILAGSLTPVAMADAALRAASFHNLLASHNALVAKNAEYEGKLRELGALEPGAGGDGGVGDAGAGGEEVKPSGNYGRDITAAAARAGVPLA